MIIIKYKRAIGLLLIAVTVIMGSCRKAADEPNKIYFNQAATSPNVDLILDGGSGQTSLSVSAAYETPNEVSVNITMLDDSYIKAYNKEHNEAYTIVPASAVTLSNTTLTIGANAAIANNGIVVTVKSWPGYIDGFQYVVALKLSGSIATIPGSDIVFVKIKKIINSDAASGRGDYKVVDGAPAYTSTSITIEGRFKYTGSTKGFSAWFSPIYSATGFFFVLNRDSKDLRVHIGSNQFGNIAQVEPNVWHHFALVKDEDNCTVYFDGVPVLKTTKPGSVTFGSGGLGMSSNAGSVAMAFSEYRIWKTARTAKQIKDNVCAAAASDPDLLAYWPLNKANTYNSGNTQISKDVTGHKYDLILSTSANNPVRWEPIKCPE
jgi:hypothetical protein